MLPAGHFGRKVNSTKITSGIYPGSFRILWEFGILIFVIAMQRIEFLFAQKFSESWGAILRKILRKFLQEVMQLLSRPQLFPI